MRSYLAVTAALALLSIATPIGAQSTPSSAAISPPVLTGIAALDEDNLVGQAHTSERAGKTSQTDQLLATASYLPDSAATAVTLGRRGASVCFWLQAENNYGQAVKLAARVLSNMGVANESAAKDQVDHLYWQALLTGRVMDQKVAAIALLEKARAITPADQRVLTLEMELAQAVATFGK